MLIPLNSLNSHKGFLGHGVYSVCSARDNCEIRHTCTKLARSNNNQKDIYIDTLNYPLVGKCL